MKKPTIGITLPDAKAFRSQRYRNYLELIEQGGGDPLPLIPGFSIDIEQIDAIILSGGGDVDPKHYGQSMNGTRESSILAARDDSEFAIMQKVIASNTPVMGICRGMQLINIYLGGTMHQDIEGISAPIHGSNGDSYQKHKVIIEKGTLLYEILGAEEIEVMSHHHQAVDSLGKDLKISAKAEDGIIEAIESANSKFILGVQWHPEVEIDEYSLKLIKALVDAALNK
jgi:putative glutamine amidotransferase